MTQTGGDQSDKVFENVRGVLDTRNGPLFCGRCATTSRREAAGHRSCPSRIGPSPAIWRPPPSADYKRCKFGFLKSHRWLHSLTRDKGDPLRNQRFMADGATVHGVDLRVVEPSAGRVTCTSRILGCSIRSHRTRQLVPG